MQRSSTMVPVGFVVLVLGLASGCASDPELFLHDDHRLKLGVDESQLHKIRFYLAEDVLLEGSGDGTGETLLFEGANAGRVTEVGPNWIRVRFGPIEDGIYFLSERHDPSYILATEPPDGFDPQRIANRSDHGMKSFKVVRGLDAALLIDKGDPRELKAEFRRRTKSLGGVEVEQDPSCRPNCGVEFPDFPPY